MKENNIQIFNKESLIKTLISIREFERLSFINKTKNSFASRDIRFVYNTDEEDYKYFNLIAEEHNTRDFLRIRDAHIKVSNVEKTIHRFAINCENNAYLIQTLNNKFIAAKNQSIISISNNMLLPCGEVKLLGGYPTFTKTINPYQQALMTKSLPVSRIDAMFKFEHPNSYEIYENGERELAMKYFQYNGTNYIPTPHFHFNSLKQSKLLVDEFKTNAIHIDYLCKYLNDLLKAYEQHYYQLRDTNTKHLPAILKYDLGMPFLDIVTKNIFIDKNQATHLIHTYNNKYIKSMFKNLESHKKNTYSGVHCINDLLRDFETFKDYVANHPTDLENITVLTTCLNTIINQSLVSGETKILENIL